MTDMQAALLERCLRDRREALDRVAGLDGQVAELDGKLTLLVHVCQDVVRDAGTDKWPVNLDRLRMALDEIGMLPEEKP